MLAGIRDILIISTSKDTPRFEQLLRDGTELGIRLSYAVQQNPDGIAQAFIIGEDFIKTEKVTLILGDNIFYGNNFTKILKNSTSRVKGATIFGYNVKDPSRFGVVEFDVNGKAISIEEKPDYPKSNFAITGLYIYDNRVVNIAKSIKPSSRRELEITDINNHYLATGELFVEVLGRGFAWLDTGTHESLLEASLFIETVENRQSLKIACLEEIAYLNGYISKDQLLSLAEPLLKNEYGQYLMRVANSKESIRRCDIC